MQILPKVLRAGAAVSVTAAAGAAAAHAHAPLCLSSDAPPGTSLLTRLLEHGELCAVPGETAMECRRPMPTRARSRQPRPHAARARAHQRCARVQGSRRSALVEKTPGHVTELDELFALFRPRVCSC